METERRGRQREKEDKERSAVKKSISKILALRWQNPETFRIYRPIRSPVHWYSHFFCDTRSGLNVSPTFFAYFLFTGAIISTE
jgi:hypothetical protein